MVEERGRAGVTGLESVESEGSYLCESVRAVSGSLLLYEVEVWRDGTQLEPVENVQIQAARILLGVGRRHPSASLQYEMGMLPLKWEAMKTVVDFWVQVMRINDDMLVKVVMLEALELGSKVR